MTEQELIEKVKAWLEETGNDPDKPGKEPRKKDYDWRGEYEQAVSLWEHERYLREEHDTAQEVSSLLDAASFGVWQWSIRTTELADFLRFVTNTPRVSYDE